MSSRDDPQQVARDFIVAVSDRRLELEGARWRDAAGDDNASAASPKGRALWQLRDRMAIELPPRLSAARLDRTPITQMRGWTLFNRISQLLHYSVLPLRWEPLNYTALHRGVASAGGLFATDTYLALPHQGVWRLFLASPNDFKLVEVAQAVPPHSGKVIELTVVARLGRLAPGYADFSLCLAGLEGGMILAQMVLLAKRLGLDLAIWGPTQPGLVTNRLDVPLFCLSIGAEEALALDDLGSGIASIALALDPPCDDAKLPALGRLLDIGVRPVRSSPISASDDAADMVKLNLFAATMQRTSGRVDGMGQARAALSHAEAQSLVARALLYHQQLPLLAPECTLVASLAMRDLLTGEVTLYAVDVSTGSLTQKKLSSDAAAAVRATCTGEFSALFSLAVATVDMVRMIANGDVLTLYAAGGMLGHSLCLAASDGGAVARPYRAMPDGLMNLLLPAETRGILQVLVGFDGRPNPMFPLG